MNDNNRYSYKQVISFGLVLALVLALTAAPPLARAEQTGEVTGIFNVATAPEITSISVKPYGGSEEATSLTPMQKYDITVEVSSSNTINDLSMLKVALWYDEDGNDYGEAKFDEVSANLTFHEEGKMISGADQQKYSTIFWDRDNVLECPWDRDDPNKPYFNDREMTFRWVLEGYSVPEQESDFENETFSFEFTVRISRVALKTYEDAKWQVAAKVFNQSELEDYLVYSAGSPDIYGLTMNWYGQVSVPSDHIVDWGKLQAGIDFDDEAARQRVFDQPKNMTVYANGYYGRQVKADTEWHNIDDGEPSSVMRTENAEDENTFALRIRPSVGHGGQEYKAEDAISLPLSVEDEEKFVTLLENLEATERLGIPVSDDHMYIKLNETFPSATYSGNITFGIFNDSPAD